MLQPMNVYARSKVAAEDLINQYRYKGLQTAILRFSSVYADTNDYPDRVIPAFCLNALQNRSIRIEGLQNQFDFTNVSDVVNGIMQTVYLLEKSIRDLPTMHLTTGIGSTLIEVVKLIEVILNKKIPYHESPQRTYDVQAFSGDPSLAMQCLKWQAQINLKDGITDLLHQYKNVLTAECMA
jgi:nucleoside-diphosphate-sugar epimerase